MKGEVFRFGYERGKRIAARNNKTRKKSSLSDVSVNTSNGRGKARNSPSSGDLTKLAQTGKECENCSLHLFLLMQKKKQNDSTHVKDLSSSHRHVN